MASLNAAGGVGTEGHLASKKARTRAEILANAITFFERSGVRAARSAEIAAASGVSPATLFNYFATRSDLAEAWVRGELDSTLQAFAAERAGRGLRAGLREVCRELSRRSKQAPGIRLEAWRVSGRAASGHPRPAHRVLAEAIEREQSVGRMRSDLEAAEIADLVLDALEGGLISMLEAEQKRGDLAESAESNGALRGRLDLVLDGARKRNERVAPPRPKVERRGPR